MVCLEASDRPPGSSRHGVGSEVRFVRLALAPTIPALCRRLVRSMVDRLWETARKGGAAGLTTEIS